ncbi:hypothetical protein C8F01DRAFT_697989 [Mycena amicta]|nr:hypothetical protein C8F01DRAFT_697989 [Mycena amicta]
MSSLINEFPSELLSKIFIDLPYRSLLAVQRVSKRWRAVVNADSELLKLLFKKRTQVFLASNTTRHEEGVHGLLIYSPSTEPVRLHPIVRHISLSIPGLRSLDDIHVSPDYPLLAIQASFDYISIPTVTRFIIKEGLSKELAENKRGVRVRDVFEAMVKQYKSGFGYGGIDSDCETGASFRRFTDVKRSGSEITARTQFS